MNKNLIKLTESDLRNLVSESVNRVLNEIGDTPNGQRSLGAVAARSIHRMHNALGDDLPDEAKYWDNVANDAAKIGHNNVQPGWEDLPDGETQYFDDGMEYWENNLKKYESKNINKKLFKLTESDLHNIIKESVNKLLREGLYDPDDDNEIFDTGFGGQYKISWEFKASNIGRDYKTVSEGEKIVETEEEAFNFAKKLAKKYKKTYATLFKIEKLIKTLSDDRWETVYDMSNGYTNVVEPNIK